MAEELAYGLLHGNVLVWIACLLLIWTLYRGLTGNNPLEWWQFIGTEIDGKWHASLDKFGQSCGIAAGTFAVLRMSAEAYKDFVGFAAVLGVYFAFVGAVSSYAAYLRSKAGSIIKTEVVEPAPDPATMKTTTTTTAPATAVPLEAKIVNVQADTANVSAPKDKV